MAVTLVSLVQDLTSHLEVAEQAQEATTLLKHLDLPMSAEGEQAAVQMVHLGSMRLLVNLNGAQVMAAVD
jgi:hypothetical protein